MKAAVYEKFCGPIAIKEVPDPKLLIGRTVSLKDSLQILVNMGDFRNSGGTVIDRFDVE